MSTPQEIRDRVVTIEMLLKAQRLQRGEIMATVLRELELTDRQRQETEDTRSAKRNSNRVLVILLAWVCSLIAPLVLVKLTHSLCVGLFSGGIGYTADLAVTAYAWLRRY
jgi:hypothetical protein